VLSKGLDRFPGNGELRYARALAADGAGDQDMMMSDLNALIEAEPDNAHALNALGYHLADNNVELDRAEELLVKANLLLPNDPAIMDSLGWLRYRQGRLQEAIELLTSAYKLYPDAEIAAHLGEAMWLNGNEEEARTLIEQALLDSPRDDHLLRFKKKFIE
jgi:Flp pilus assembly protein TadD